MNDDPTPSVAFRIRAAAPVDADGAPDALKPAPKCEHCDVPIRVHGDKGYCPTCGRVVRGLGATAKLKAKFGTEKHQ